MPNHFRQDFKVADEDLSIFDRKILQSGRKNYGQVEYVIAFDKNARAQIFVRERNDVDDGQGKDPEWQRYHHGLNAEAQTRGHRQNHVRVETRGNKNVIWISEDCDPFDIGEDCPGYDVTCRTPKKVRPSLALGLLYTNEEGG